MNDIRSWPEFIWSMVATNIICQCLALYLLHGDTDDRRSCLINGIPGWNDEKIVHLCNVRMIKGSNLLCFAENLRHQFGSRLLVRVDQLDDHATLRLRIISFPELTEITAY